MAIIDLAPPTTADPRVLRTAPQRAPIPRPGLHRPASTRRSEVSPAGVAFSLATPSLALVAANSALRAALPLLLTGFTVTGQFATVEGLIETHPSAEIVLVDAPDGASAGADGIRAATRAGYRVCVHTTETRRAVVARYLAAGARGVIAQSDPVESLAGSLARIAAGATAISDRYADIAAAGSDHELTGRQLQILAGRARGETFSSIAGRLAISERTAQDHWSAIARRYDLFLKDHSPADLERSLGLDAGAAPLDR